MVFKAGVAAFWFLVTGALGVHLELLKIRAGHRIHQRQLELDAVLERVRLKEIRYNRLVSLDVLEKDLEAFLRLPPGPGLQ